MTNWIGKLLFFFMEGGWISVEHCFSHNNFDVHFFLQTVEMFLLHQLRQEHLCNE